MDTVQLTIDNKPVVVKKGITILEAASSAGVHIPTLCHMKLDDLNIENRPGGCRICVVEVEGRRNLAPACCTEVADGMVINSHNIRVINARQTVLELILSDHPADCLICAKSGNCDYKGEQSTYREDTSPAIIRDVDKCIMCRRCEMMCNEVQTVGVLSAINRGFNAVVSPAFEMNLDHSVCTYCGQCVAVCPTGALTEVDQTAHVIRALSDPSKTVIRHSGRSRSKSVMLCRRHSSMTSAHLARAGIRNRRRWKERSKSVSITMRGASYPRGPSITF